MTIRIQYSSVNYKDAMAAHGVGGMVRRFPHVPGVDLAGEVVSDTSGVFSAGRKVLATGFDLGVEVWGGFAQYARVPAGWVVPLPAGLDMWEAMAIGTAGLTAMLSLMALERHRLKSADGPVLVLGATGGVGSLAVDILSGAGYEVAAATGNSTHQAWISRLGAAWVVDRRELAEPSPKMLTKATWAGVVDPVGGSLLANVLKGIKPGGAPAVSGLVGGADLHTSVYPFILRGASLLGVDSAHCPNDLRQTAWTRLAGGNKPRHLSNIARTIHLEGL
ncbi:MAG: acryloyl-CoA reductase, partial [Deltaproteobacteria bacterium]|nr:acryloyl-CoA reductase [Deltaproteobacteria bacterium]